MPFSRSVSTSRRRAPRNLAPSTVPATTSPRASQHAVVREVEMQRRDRDVALLDRAEVGVLLAGPGDRAAADPVDVATPRILHRRERTASTRACPSRVSLHASDSVGRHRRKVHVEQRVRGKGRQRREVREQRREHLHLLAAAASRPRGGRRRRTRWRSTECRARAPPSPRRPCPSTARPRPCSARG